MHKRFLLLSLAVFLIATAGGVSAKPTAYEGSVKYKDYDGEADEDGADRGVLGVRYMVGTDLLGKTHAVVMNVVKDGPADKAGLKRGDRIVQVNGMEVDSLGRKDVGRRMRGEPGTQLALEVKRGAQTLEINIIRGGLTQLPDKAFQARMYAQVNVEERDTRIKALAAKLDSEMPGLADSIKSESFTDALTQLRRASKGLNPLPDVRLLYGLVADRLNKEPEAQDVLESLVESKPKFTDAWLSLALVYENQGKVEEAVHALKKAALLIKDRTQEKMVRQRIAELSERKVTP